MLAYNVECIHRATGRTELIRVNADNPEHAKHQCGAFGYIVGEATQIEIQNAAPWTLGNLRPRSSSSTIIAITFVVAIATCVSAFGVYRHLQRRQDRGDSQNMASKNHATYPTDYAALSAIAAKFANYQNVESEILGITVNPMSVATGTSHQDIQTLRTNLGVQAKWLVRSYMRRGLPAADIDRDVLFFAETTREEYTVTLTNNMLMEAEIFNANAGLSANPSRDPVAEPIRKGPEAPYTPGDRKR